MNDALKPCPFCGSKKVLVSKFQSSSTMRWRYEIYCSCDASLFVEGRYDEESLSHKLKNELILKWNRRAKK